MASTTDWKGQVVDALAHLVKAGRKLSPAEYREIIDDVVIGTLTAAEIAEKHGTHDLVMTALGHVTTAIQGGGAVRPLAEGGWYVFKGHHQPYAVAPGFTAAWKEARDIS
jgi:hypothetical protein